MRVISGSAGQTPKEHVAAEPSNRDTGERAQPGIELLGHDIARSIQGDRSESENTRRMRDSDDQAKKKSMTRCSLRSDEIGGDDRLAMTRLQGVETSKADGYESRREQKPCAEVLRLNQFGESASRSLLTIDLEMHLRKGCRRRSAKLRGSRGGMSCGRLHDDSGFLF